MKNLLFWGGLTSVCGLMFGAYSIIDHKINPPPAPIVVEERIVVLEEIRKLRIIPYSERLQATYHNTHGCDDNPAYYYFARTCLTLQGVGKVSAEYDFSNVPDNAIRKAGNTFIVSVGAPEISVNISSADIREIVFDFGVWNTDATVSEHSRQSRIALEASLRSLACKRKLLERASVELNKGLPNLVRLASGTQVKVRFETAPGTC
jgi:hypothetical protein